MVIFHYPVCQLGIRVYKKLETLNKSQDVGVIQVSWFVVILCIMNVIQKAADINSHVFCLRLFSCPAAG
jgi:hypothetical protein